MISHNLPAVVKILGRIPKDVDFAGVVALTRTAKLIQNVVKDEARKRFNLRNNFVLRGVRIIPATRSKVEARVFTDDPNLPVQDEGGVRRRKEFLIPGKRFLSVTGTNPREAIIPRGLRPPRLFTKKIKFKTARIRKKKPGGKVKRRKTSALPFITKSKKSGIKIIAVRRTTAARPIGVIYIAVKNKVNIKRRPFFEVPADKEYDDRFQEEYDRAFSQFVKLT